MSDRNRALGQLSLACVRVVVCILCNCVCNGVPPEEAKNDREA